MEQENGERMKMGRKEEEEVQKRKKNEKNKMSKGRKQTIRKKER
jgi:hypothetical protein